MLFLGNLEAKRDWGHAQDYVRGMWLMLQKEQPQDYVLATETTHSVRDFLETAFLKVDIEIIWEGKGAEEVGKDKKSGEVLVKIDEKYLRLTEVDYLLGNAEKARVELRWKPEISFDVFFFLISFVCHTTCNDFFQELVSRMVRHDLQNFGSRN